MASSTTPTNFRDLSLGLLPLTIMLSGALTASDALAQDASGEEIVPASLQEIVVTARRRSESIDNVPISLVAFSGEALAAHQVLTTQALTELTPNLQFSPVAPSSGNNAAGVIYIRGVGETDFIASTSATNRLIPLAGAATSVSPNASTPGPAHSHLE
jgi:outer membrane receptor protein involved in Fe transport